MKTYALLEKVFLVEIDSLDNEEGCYASNDYFSNFFKLSKNRCSEIIKSLEKKGLVKISYKYKPNTKLIEKRIIKVFEISNIGIRDSEEGIRNLDRGYSENCEDNNTIFNNTFNNNRSSNKTSLEDVIAYYRREIVNRHVLTKLEQDFFLEIGNKVSYDLVIRAMEISIESNARELRYIKGIIKRWTDENIKTLEQLEAYKLQQQSKQKGVKTNGSSTKRTKQFEQQIPVDDEKDEEYYRLLKECERLSRE